MSESVGLNLLNVHGFYQTPSIDLTKTLVTNFSSALAFICPASDLDFQATPKRRRNLGHFFKNIYQKKIINRFIIS